jgi:hypothetical protein
VTISDPNPAKPEPNRTSKNIFYRDGQDIQDKNEIKSRLNQKPFILFIPVNFVFEGFIVLYFAQ